MALKRRSAKELLRARLSAVGLGALTDWWWKRQNARWTPAEIWVAARGTSVYKRRFAGLDKARAAGFQINEQSYVDFEQTAKALGRQFDIPPKMIAALVPKWVALGVSPNEIQARLDQNVAAIDHYVASNPEVQAELAAAERYYGVKPTRGDLLAMVLNPTLGAQEATKRLQAVRLGAQAETSGYGALSRSEAETLYGYDVTAEEGEEGFGQLYEASELFQSLDSGEDAISRQDQFGATFGGNAAAKRRIEERARRRKAGFESGGGYASDKGGFAGLGSAST